MFRSSDVYLTMKNALAQLMAASLLLGCDGLADAHTRPPPLAIVRGTLNLAEHTAPPEGDLRLAVMWDVWMESDPSPDQHDPMDPCAEGESKQSGELDANGDRIDGNRFFGVHFPLGFAEQPVQLTSEFPIKFTLELTEPPPPEAFATRLPDFFEPERMASGQLVVYRDGNSNAKLDMSTFSQPSPDQLLGVSAGPWWKRRDSVVDIDYIERRPVFDERGARALLRGAPGYDEAGLERARHQYDYLQPGYNLVRRSVRPETYWSEDYERLPDDATIPIVLDANGLLQQKLCQVICQKPEDGGCPSDPTDLPPVQPGASIDYDDAFESGWHLDEGGRMVQGSNFCSIDEFGNHTYEYWRSDCQGCACNVLQCLYRREELAADIELPCGDYKPH